MNSNKLYDELNSIIDNILTITAVKSDIGYPCADPWLADISVHCLDEKIEEEVINEICRIYNMPNDQFLIDSTMPLMLLALRIYFYNKCTLDIQIEMKPYIIKLEENEKELFGEEE